MERAYTEAFTIGRGIQATLHVDSGRVSRLHAEVVYEDGEWVLRDAGSTNGTYHKEERVNRVPLAGGETAVRLGREGPFVYLSIAEAGEDVGRVQDSAGTTAPASRRRSAEEDTQRQSQSYRPRRAEEPTAWHDAAEHVSAGSAVRPETRQPVGHEAPRRAALPSGAVMLGALLALLLVAIVLLVV